MTREEAIALFEKQLTAAQVVLDSGFGSNPGENDFLYRRRKEMAEIALTALRPVSREQVERMRATLEPTTLPDGTKTVATKCSECGAHNLITHLFCWRCGSPLTDVAVDILVRRLEEALKDGD